MSIALELEKAKIPLEEHIVSDLEAKDMESGIQVESDKQLASNLRHGNHPDASQHSTLAVSSHEQTLIFPPLCRLNVTSAWRSNVPQLGSTPWWRMCDEIASPDIFDSFDSSYVISDIFHQ
jgi:hypothetical protein